MRRLVFLSILTTSEASPVGVRSFSGQQIDKAFVQISSTSKSKKEIEK